MTCAQTDIPRHFASVWRIAGWIDEHPFATRRCKALGYAQAPDGADMVLVELLDKTDLFDPETIEVPPHMLLPLPQEAAL